MIPDPFPEQTIRLPDSFWCYDPLEFGVSGGLPVGPLPALTNGHITFGCLNNFCKINPVVLSLWAQVLKRVDRSRLLLLAPPGGPRQLILDQMSQQGVDTQRILFAPRQNRRGYLELYRQIDVGLDSYPYNGHTTSLDSFWMGVPVVTLVGQTSVSRAGWCQLSNLGLCDLAGHTPDQFVEVAVELAGDLQRLESLRTTLRHGMEQSTLMNGKAYADHIEKSYRQMWHGWLRNP